jgi:hypothetical protein
VSSGPHWLLSYADVLCWIWCVRSFLDNVTGMLCKHCVTVARVQGSSARYTESMHDVLRWAYQAL